MVAAGWCVLLSAISIVKTVRSIHTYRHNKHDVHFAGFFPTSLGYLETSIGQGVLPAVKLAIRHVNQSPNVLPRNKIRMHWNNTAVRGKNVVVRPVFFFFYSVRTLALEKKGVDNVFTIYNKCYSFTICIDHLLFWSPSRGWG